MSFDINATVNRIAPGATTTVSALVAYLHRTPDHTVSLVGDSGGRSRIIGAAQGSLFRADLFDVKTEHGTLYLDGREEVTVDFTGIDHAAEAQRLREGIEARIADVDDELRQLAICPDGDEEAETMRIGLREEREVLVDILEGKQP